MVDVAYKILCMTKVHIELFSILVLAIAIRGRVGGESPL